MAIERRPQRRRRSRAASWPALNQSKPTLSPYTMTGHQPNPCRAERWHRRRDELEVVPPRRLETERPDIRAFDGDRLVDPGGRADDRVPGERVEALAQAFPSGLDRSDPWVDLARRRLSFSRHEEEEPFFEEHDAKGGAKLVGSRLDLVMRRVWQPVALSPKRSSVTGHRNVLGERGHQMMEPLVPVFLPVELQCLLEHGHGPVRIGYADSHGGEASLELPARPLAAAWRGTTERRAPLRGRQLLQRRRLQQSPSLVLNEPVKDLKQTVRNSRNVVTGLGLSRAHYPVVSMMRVASSSSKPRFGHRAQVASRISPPVYSSPSVRLIDGRCQASYPTPRPGQTACTRTAGDVTPTPRPPRRQPPGHRRAPCRRRSRRGARRRTSDRAGLLRAGGHRCRA